MNEHDRLALAFIEECNLDVAVLKMVHEAGNQPRTASCGPGAQPAPERAVPVTARHGKVEPSTAA